MSTKKKAGETEAAVEKGKEAKKVEVKSVSNKSEKASQEENKKEEYALFLLHFRSNASKKEEKNVPDPSEKINVVPETKNEDKKQNIEIHPLVHLFKNNKKAKQTLAYLESIESSLKCPPLIQEVSKHSLYLLVSNNEFGGMC